MNTSTNTTIDTRMLDDLLWLRALVIESWSYAGRQEAVEAMLVEYAADPDHYSDGSPIGGEYIPDDVPNVIAYGAFPPPHRR